MSRVVSVKASWYQQFDADPSRDVPAESYGGWQRVEIPLALDHTALVVMHAWDTGSPEEFPGWWRAVEYMGRAQRILAEVFPPLLDAARRAGLRIYHVVGGGSYYRHLPQYRGTLELAGPDPPPPDGVPPDPIYDRLRAFRSEHVFVGRHNEADVRRGFENTDFAAEARPADNEPVAENGRQLLALCRRDGVNHLIYAGFAVNWCLLLSPGGMWEMSRYGALCSVIRQATTAVENKETARQELCKEIALWRVALAFGFVFDLEDFVGALDGQPSP